MTHEEFVGKLLEELSPREQKILSIRYGLADGNLHTLEEIGQEFGVTRERIRDIEQKALKKLRDRYGDIWEVLNFHWSFVKYRCLCGKYKGKRCIGVICDKCGVEVLLSQEIARRARCTDCISA